MLSTTENLIDFQKIVPLPAITFLTTLSMYILNDLVDADLDKINSKKRPIPSGIVSKKQTWIFIVLTSGMALLISIMTFNLILILIATLMLVLGILYSAPRIALMRRFVIKTVTIAIYYCVCALLGVTAIHGLDLTAENFIILAHGLSILFIMIFISSTLNDLGDIEGDRAAGRRTIPIVIGKDNTIKLSMTLALSMLFITWALYMPINISGHHGNVVTSVLTTFFALVVASKLAKMRKGLHDMESMRKHHKKLFPLNIILQTILIAGGLILI